uniref:Uncharacterized LOC103367538 n=1 Tax=Stegastes partitus TaxID=144197 RepID=A0A3B5AR12_9TELE
MIKGKDTEFALLVSRHLRPWTKTRLSPEPVSITLFHGEDFHILLPSLEVEVIFQNRSAPRSPNVLLMKGVSMVSGRAKLNRYLSHLVIDAVGEGDEGVYYVKNPENSTFFKNISLIVRDCSNELNIKYGDNFRIPLSGVNHPITLDFRSSAVELPTEPYQGRITVSERNVTLLAVTGADEGSYTVMDNKGVIQRKVCLNVKEHQNFVTLPYGKRLKINLVLSSSLVQLFYSPNDAPAALHLLLDKGQFTSLGFEDRISLEGSYVYLDQVKGADSGQFKIMDILGFTVSSIYLDVEPYRLESLYVAIIALLGLLVFLLLVCLLSCLIKVKKRAKRAAALEKIAQNAGKEEEGEAFRQVREPNIQYHFQCDDDDDDDDDDVYSGTIMSFVSSVCAHLHRWSRTSQNSVKNPSIHRLTIQRNLRALRWTLR